MLRSVHDKIPSPQPHLNLNSCSNTTNIKLPENPLSSFESIQLLIDQIASENMSTSESAMRNLNEILLRPNVRLLSKVIYFIINLQYLFILDEINVIRKL